MPLNKICGVLHCHDLQLPEIYHITLQEGMHGHVCKNNVYLPFLYREALNRQCSCQSTQLLHLKGKITIERNVRY